MLKSYDNKPTSSVSAAASDERISVIKLSKSGGCVDRDAAFMKGIRESQIRSYFFGNPIPSTASSALSLSATSSLTNVTLSPHASQLDFGSLAVYSYSSDDGGEGGIGGDEDEDEYDPSQFGTADSFLPGGAGESDLNPSQQQHNESSSATLPGIGTAATLSSSSSSNPPQPQSSSLSTIPLKKLPTPPPTTLANTLLAITHARSTSASSSSSSSLAEIRDASIMGFLYVADVDSEKGKIRVLAPVGGRVPPRAIVWGKKWPGEVVGLVG